MSANEEDLLRRGAEAASEVNCKNEDEKDDPLRGVITGEEMKRAAARKLIERYYYQLTEGCHTLNCTNEHCVSSGKVKALSADAAAVQAIELFKAKATLCDPNPAKVARRPLVSFATTTVAAAATDVATPAKMNDLSAPEFVPSALSVPVVRDICHAKDTSALMDTSEMVSPSSQKQFSWNVELVSPEPSASTSTAKSKDLLSSIYLTESRVLEIIDICKEEGTFSLLIRTIGQVFSRADALMKSFRKERSALRLESLTKEDLRANEEDQDKDLDSKEEEEKVINRMPVGGGGAALRPDEVTLDLESLNRTYSALFAIPGVPFQGALIHAVFILYDSAKWDLECRNVYEQDENYLNIFLIILEIPFLCSDDLLETVLKSFCKAAALLPLAAQTKMARVVAKYGAQRLNDLVEVLQQLITSRVVTGQVSQDYCVNDDDAVVSATKVMKVFFYAAILGGRSSSSVILDDTDQAAEGPDDNFLQGAVGRENKEPKPEKEDPLARELGVTVLDCHKPLIPFTEFYNELLNDSIEMERDFTYYRASQDRSKFSFMNYSFILTPATKALGLYYDNRVQMYSERRMSALQSIFVGEAEFIPYNPYLKLKVRRDHIIDDALIELEMVAMENPTDLKKQLVVEFEGEQGIDEGGVSKEFFQVVVDEIFNPNFGMFTLNPETHVYWFNPTSFESDAQFTLIGIVLGLAIYNSVILDVDFPNVVYRKLMGKRGVFEDLADWDPSLYQGLVNMLEYTESDIEDVFMQTFRINYRDIFGSNLTYDLKENANQITVNHANKREFVDLYADFLLNKSVRKQFLAFRRGFLMVTGESPLKWLFLPEEVELLVRGSKIFDFNALEESVEYDGGYTASTPIIKHFWEIVHHLSHDEKRKLLQFTTGSDRAPVGGLSKLKLIIAKNGSDSNRLPTAHTCFNVLLLPEYSSKEKLKERLIKAINYSKGFGLL